MPEINQIKYDPTPENIAISPELESIMVQAMKHVETAESPLKRLVRWQFWMRKAYDLGRDAGIRESMNAVLHPPLDPEKPKAKKARGSSNE